MSDPAHDGTKPHETFRHYAEALVEQVNHFKKSGQVTVPSIESVLKAKERLAPCLLLIPDLSEHARMQAHSKLQTLLDQALDVIIRDMSDKKWELRSAAPDI